MPLRLSGAKVRAKMSEKAISPARLASVSGLSPSTIDRIINDRASSYNSDTVQRIADAIGCNPFELYTDQAVNAAITQAVSTSVETVVVEAVAEAVTAVVEEVAPATPPPVIAKNIPELPVGIPPLFDVPAYIAHIKEEHQRDMEQLIAEHKDHTADLRRTARAWQTVAIALAALLFLCLIFHGAVGC